MAQSQHSIKALVYYFYLQSFFALCCKVLRVSAGQSRRLRSPLRTQFVQLPALLRQRLNQKQWCLKS